MLKNSFIKDIEELYARRIKQSIPNLTKDDLKRDGLVIFGAGAYGRLIVQELVSQGVVPVWIVDKNPALNGADICGLPVRPLPSLAECQNHFVMLSSRYLQSMIDDCSRHNVKKWILPSAVSEFCFIAGEFGIAENTDKHIDEIVSAFSILEDGMSKAIFKEFIQYHLTFEPDLFKEHDPQTYFPADLAGQIDYSHFIDAGAFTGDTLESWITYYDPLHRTSPYAYHAFEPGREQFDELQTYAKSLPATVRKNIFLKKAALGSRAETLTLAGTGAAACLCPHEGNGFAFKETVPVFRLDDVFSHESPTVIKADVEGSELPLLEGARAVIERCRPSLAVSVYHRYADIWEIPLWIHRLNCDYKIYLRHHFPSYGDTVCYAIPQ